jgi:hypothetical protein
VLLRSSPLQRGIASALFAAPPVSSFEEALAHFLRHEELLQDKGGGLVRNKIFVGDTLLKLNRKDEAAKYFEQATKVKTKLLHSLVFSFFFFLLVVLSHPCCPDGSEDGKRPQVRGGSQGKLKLSK